MRCMISFGSYLSEYRGLLQQLCLIGTFFLVALSGCTANFEDNDLGDDSSLYGGDDTSAGADQCPEDDSKLLPGICGCNVSDTDTDLDGTLDCHDGCPNDPSKTKPGAWYPDCDGDGQFSSFSTKACDQTGADAAFKCRDGSPPDGGWSTTPGDDISDDGEVSDGNAGWFGDGWQYRRKITVSRSQVVGTHSFFPMVISTSLDSWKGSVQGGHVHQGDGGDFVFTGKDGTSKLNHEIEAYDDTTGKLVVWVKVPKISGLEDAVIYMYYGNPDTELENQSSTAEVWDEGGHNSFKGVWHNAEKSTGNRRDSTRFANNCSCPGYDGNEDIVGKIGGADQLDGDDDWLSCGQEPGLNIQDELTLSAWIKPSLPRVGKEKWVNVLWKKNAYGFYLYGSSDRLTTLGVDFKINGVKADHSDKGTLDIPPGVWSYLVVTYDGSDLKAYVNAKLDYTVSAPGTIDDSLAEVLTVSESEKDKGIYLNGAIDEMRVSGKARSAGWITTSFHNQKSPASFYSIGNEVAR